jgi:effector-binding domain-containing protein
MDDHVHPTEPELVDHSATITAVIGGVVPTTDLPGFFDQAFSELGATLADQGIEPTGPAFARYAGPLGDAADLEVGFPTAVAVAPSGAVRPSSLPAGQVARLVHLGSFDRLHESWERLGEWITSQGRTAGEVFWEVYVTEPNPDMDPAELRTDLFRTVR